jgi:hypothetical protein
MYPAKVGDLVHDPTTGEAFVLADPDTEAQLARCREALNLALMHLEDPRAIAAVRASLDTQPGEQT